MRNIFITFIIFIVTMSNVSAQNADYLFMIEHAIKAPSGHNTQPWLFKIYDSEIDICPDFTKSLPAVDPDNRELFVSLGCATENLCIAASHKGYKGNVFVTNNGVIKIMLSQDSLTVASTLFPQIPIRQTNRAVYNGEIVPDHSIALLKGIDVETCIGVHFFKNGTPEYETISEMVYRGNSVQMNDKKFKEELQQWMRYNKKHQDSTRDGLSYAVFGAPNIPRFIAKLIIKGTIKEKSQNKNDRKKIASSSHFILLTTSENTIEQWIALGRTLERILLKTTEMGISHAYLNQPNEVSELSVEMAKKLGLSNEYPTVFIRIGYGKKMPYSLRRSIESCILPIEKNSND